jgi:hypothetical protein
MIVPKDDFSYSEDNIFEEAVKSGGRKLTANHRSSRYVAEKDYRCIINSKCPSGKKCGVSSSGREYVITLTWDVPGNDLVQYNWLENAQACMDKCEGYGSRCQSMLFLKNGVVHGGVRGRCWLKT